MAIQWAPILTSVLAEVVPAVIDLVKTAIEASKGNEEESKKLAEEFRNTPITLSISFGGGDGDAVKYQRTIEAKLPADFSLDD